MLSTIATFVEAILELLLITIWTLLPYSNITVKSYIHSWITVTHSHSEITINKLMKSLLNYWADYYFYNLF